MRWVEVRLGGEAIMGHILSNCHHCHVVEYAFRVEGRRQAALVPVVSLIRVGRLCEWKFPETGLAPRKCLPYFTS